MFATIATRHDLKAEREASAATALHEVKLLDQRTAADQTPAQPNGAERRSRSFVRTQLLT